MLGVVSYRGAEGDREADVGEDVEEVAEVGERGRHVLRRFEGGQKRELP